MRLLNWKLQNVIKNRKDASNKYVYIMVMHTLKESIVKMSIHPNEYGNEKDLKCPQQFWK